MGCSFTDRLPSFRCLTHIRLSRCMLRVTILSYLPSKSISPSHAFLSAHFSAPSGAERPETVSAIANLAQDKPAALKWPIVVDWSGGQASIGDVEGVKVMLEKLRQRRDGEAKEEDIQQPKGWFK